MLTKESREALMYECMSAAARCMEQNGREEQAIARAVAIVKATLAADAACGPHGQGSIADRALASITVKNSA